MHRPYTAYFIGTPQPDEVKILSELRLAIDVQIFTQNQNTCQQIEASPPDYILVPVSYASSSFLQLFQSLRQHGITCTMVWDDDHITAFTGPRYRWRRAAPKNLQGLEDLMIWAKWPLPINRKQMLISSDSLIPVDSAV